MTSRKRTTEIIGDLQKHGMTQEQIAELFGVPDQTVRLSIGIIEALKSRGLNQRQIADLNV